QQGAWSTDPVWQAETVNSDLVNSQTGYHYLHSDHLWTPHMATDKTGAITWKAVSEAFGATEAVENSVQVRLRFPGQYWDQESNSHYNFHRDYRPEVGGYLKGDPIGLNGGINFYMYANINPLKLIDDLGLFPGGFMAGPGNPDGTINTIYCMEEKVELYILPIPGYEQCPAIEKCIRVHEDSHRQDAYAFNQNICKGRKDGLQVGYYDGVEGGDSRFYTIDSELKAYEKQIKCLKDALKKGCDQECRAMIERDIAQREIEAQRYRSKRK
ncbi:RHS repeat-associated core domain-containing protein, partial [Comamonas sp. JUb58]|uniref:RHS repeat domain-containing protein n=1 Tax=Comamonas sp. JUb58 TaxID=2485114 RepID=UPI0010EF9211